jgi:hypothetical protein
MNEEIKPFLTDNAAFQIHHQSLNQKAQDIVTSYGLACHLMEEGPGKQLLHYCLRYIQENTEILSVKMTHPATFRFIQVSYKFMYDLHILRIPHIILLILLLNLFKAGFVNCNCSAGLS